MYISFAIGIVMEQIAKLEEELEGSLRITSPVITTQLETFTLTVDVELSCFFMIMLTDKTVTVTKQHEIFNLNVFDKVDHKFGRNSIVIELNTTRRFQLQFRFYRCAVLGHQDQLPTIYSIDATVANSQAGQN